MYVFVFVLLQKRRPQNYRHQVQLNHRVLRPNNPPGHRGPNGPRVRAAVARQHRIGQGHA